LYSLRQHRDRAIARPSELLMAQSLGEGALWALYFATRRYFVPPTRVLAAMNEARQEWQVRMSLKTCVDRRWLGNPKRKRRMGTTVSGAEVDCSLLVPQNIGRSSLSHTG